MTFSKIKKYIEVLKRPYTHSPIHPYLLALTLLFSAISADASSPEAKRILNNASKHFEIVKDYTADLVVSVESPSVNAPDMRMKIYFKQPDKLHMESKDGFAMLPRQGAVVGNPLRHLLASLDVAISGSERVLNEDCHVIKGSFEQDGRVTQSTVWIDKKDFLVRQIYANPEWGPAVRVKLWYARVDRKYWMPLTTIAQVSFPPLPGEKEEERQKGKPTIVTLKFSNYRVNAGISDKIFQK